MTRMEAEKQAADANRKAPKGSTFVAVRHSFNCWAVREHRSRSKHG